MTRINTNLWNHVVEEPMKKNRRSGKRMLIILLVLGLGALGVAAAQAANRSIQLNSPASFPVDI